MRPLFATIFLWQKFKKTKKILPGKTTTITQLKQAAKQISDDMDIENLKHTMQNLVTDMSALKKGQGQQDDDNDSTSGTEMDDSFESCPEDNEISAGINDSIATPSAVSRMAKNILKSNIKDGEIKPLLKRGKRHIVSSSESQGLALPSRNSHKSYSHNNELRLLKRRINNLVRALRIMKLSKDQLEEQLDVLRFFF